MHVTTATCDVPLRQRIHMKKHTIILTALLASTLLVSSSFGTILMNGVSDKFSSKNPSASTIKGYEGWAIIESAQLGGVVSVSDPSGGQREASRPNFSEITLSKVADAFSPYFLLSMAQGQSIGRVDLVWLIPKGTSYQKTFSIALEEVIVTSHSMSFGADQPYESVSLDWGQLTLDVYDDAGGIASTTTIDRVKGTSSGT